MVISPTHSGLRLALHFVQFLFAAVYLLLLSFFTVALLRALFVAPPWLLVGTLLLIAFLWGWMFSVTLPQLHGYAGSERVRLHEGRLEIRRSLFGIRWKAGAAEAREIRGLTVEQPALWLRQPTRLIVVDCKTRRFAFGGGLQYEQGQELAGRLRRALRR